MKSKIIFSIFFILFIIFLFFPKYHEPFQNQNDVCDECANSNPLQKIKEDISEKHEDILKMLNERDIKYKNLSEKVQENTNYINKMKMLEKQMTEEPKEESTST